jgi:hypothetical protein
MIASNLCDYVHCIVGTLLESAAHNIEHVIDEKLCMLRA